MKITITVEIDDEERKAIAADILDFDTTDPIDFTKRKVRPAGLKAVTKWLQFGIRQLLTATLETYDQGGVK